MENNLPVSWELINLVEDLDFRPTRVEKYAGVKKYYSTGSIQDSNCTPEGEFTFENRPSRANREAKLNDVLQARMKNTDKGILVNENFDGHLFSTGFIQIKSFADTYNSKLLFYLIKSDFFLNQKNDYATGSTQEALTDDGAKKIIIPLPPLAEQHRIVAKLDAVMQKVESNKQRLDKIPKLLKRFRQSVLAGAVSGRLTEDWRGKNGIIEDWKELPLEECIHELRNGLGKKPNITPPGIPILRISALRPGFVDFDDIRYYNSKENNIENFYLKKYDLLFTRYNGSIEFLGVCGLVRDIDKNYVYPDKLMRVRTINDKLNPYYCEIYFQSEQARNEILKYAKSSAGQNGISGGDLKKVIVNLPPLTEQKEIVRRVEQLFAFADKIEARYTKAKSMLDKLPQSILAKAFRGELVAQDPNDEPASVLLEKIKAEKAKLAVKKRN